MSCAVSMNQCFRPLLTVPSASSPSTNYNYYYITKHKYVCNQNDDLSSKHATLTSLALESNIRRFLRVIKEQL